MTINYEIMSIKGTEHCGDRHESLRAGERLTLVPEPSNRHDPNAVRVQGTAFVYQNKLVDLGYVPKNSSARIAQLLRNGTEIVAVYIGKEFGPRMMLICETDLKAAVQ